MYNSLKNKIKSRQFAVTRRRYSSLLEVPRRGIHNVIAIAMSIFNNIPHSVLKRHSLPQGAREKISVALGNKVMDTRLPQPVGCGGKHDVDSSVQFGRSMIEMLGVLAIIAVLSVGGIAGYSKAMQKWKVDEMIGQYNMLVYGLLENKDNIIKTKESLVPLNNLVKQLGLVPETWKIAGIRLDDGFGNLIYPYAAKKGVYGATSDRIVVDLNLGGLTSGRETSAAFSDKLCFEIFNTMLIPLHYAIGMAWLYRDGTAGSTRYYGDAVCGNDKKCLKDMTFAEIKTLCNLCDKANQRCNVTFYIN